ncbi:MAG: 6-hydroxymethylpterin diphosphokinase MptE-like protein [bacterium]
MKTDYTLQNLDVIKRKEQGLYLRLKETRPKEHSFPEYQGLIALLKKEDPSNYNTIVVSGFGEGDHIKELLRRTSEKTFILIVEKDIEIFRGVIKRKDLSFLSGSRIGLSVGEEPEYAIKFRIDNHYKVNTIADILGIEYTPACNLYGEYYARVKKAITESSIIASYNLATVVQNSILWQTQIFQNLPLIVKNPPASLLFDRFKNIPAIIVSAGPSLDKNVDELSKAKGKALILCVDTALRTLLNHKIIPDVVVVLDASEHNYRLYLEGILSPDFRVLTSSAVFPEVFKAQGEMFVTGFGHPFMLWIERFIGARGVVKFGGSVSTSAFDFAIRIGANPIIFIGQDLSYPEGKFYTEGVPEAWQKEVEKKVSEMKKMMVPGIMGGEVETTEAMWAWIEWFGFEIGLHKGIRFINATEGGAAITGTEVMKLSEVIDRFCTKEVNIERRFKEARSDRPQNLNNLIEGLASLSIDLKTVLYTARYGVSLSERLLDAYKNSDSVNVAKLLKEAGSLYEEIISHKGLLSLAKWSLEKTLFILEKMKNNVNEEEKVSLLLTFFMEVAEYCDTSLKSIEEARGRLLEQ